MAFVETDVVYRLTSTGPGPGENDATTDPNASLGGWLSLTNVDLTTSMNNLWDNLASSEAIGGSTEYRCISILNTNAAQTWHGAQAWIVDDVAGGAAISIGVDINPATTRASAVQQFVVVADEGTAPAGIVFSYSTSKSAAISLGDIEAQYTRGLWLRRVIAPGTTGQLDGATIRVEGNSTE